MSSRSDRRGHVWPNSAAHEVYSEYLRLRAQFLEAYEQWQLLRAREWLYSNPASKRCGESLLPRDMGAITKRASEHVARFYGRTSEIEKQPWGTKIRCALNAREASPVMLKKAFARMCDRTLRQMRNPDLRGAGYVLEPEVEGGVIDLVAIVTDETAARKIASAVTPES